MLCSSLRKRISCALSKPSCFSLCRVEVSWEFLPFHIDLAICALTVQFLFRQFSCWDFIEINFFFSNSLFHYFKCFRILIKYNHNIFSFCFLTLHLQVTLPPNLLIPPSSHSQICDLFTVDYDCCIYAKYIKNNLMSLISVVCLYIMSWMTTFYCITN